MHPTWNGSYWVKTTTHPDTGTRIKTYDQDGQLVSITGTGVHPVGYTYGADGSGSYVITTKLDAGGSDTDEWTQSYTDLLGRQHQTIYASGSDTPTATSYYNNLGQLTSQGDPDNVTNLFFYNAKGERTTTVLDMGRADAFKFGQ